ncbi:hypothetical protein AB0J21_20870 [Streptomyces sp. NPDC049954]|uniref:hypothetical protein n=1 Tax=Streptomyces sp. NPDC049954 TaxID=3155779 RepID=UPI0034362F57
MAWAETGHPRHPFARVRHTRDATARAQPPPAAPQLPDRGAESAISTTLVGLTLTTPAFASTATQAVPPSATSARACPYQAKKITNSSGGLAVIVWDKSSKDVVTMYTGAGVGNNWSGCAAYG